MPASSSDSLALTASMTSRWSSAIRIFMAFPSDMDEYGQADDNGERDAHQGGFRSPNDIAPKRYGAGARR